MNSFATSIDQDPAETIFVLSEMDFTPIFTILETNKSITHTVALGTYDSGNLLILFPIATLTQAYLLSGLKLPLSTFIRLT